YFGSLKFKSRSFLVLSLFAKSTFDRLSTCAPKSRKAVDPRPIVYENFGPEPRTRSRNVYFTFAKPSRGVSLLSATMLRPTELWDLILTEAPALRRSATGVPLASPSNSIDAPLDSDCKIVADPAVTTLVTTT